MVDPQLGNLPQSIASLAPPTMPGQLNSRITLIAEDETVSPQERALAILKMLADTDIKLLNVFNYANIFHKLGKLAKLDPEVRRCAALDWTGKVYDTVCGLAEDFLKNGGGNPRAIACISQGVAQVGKPAEDLSVELAAAAKRLAPFANEIELSNMIPSFALLGIRDEELWKTLMMEAMRRLGSFSGKSFINMACGAAIASESLAKDFFAAAEGLEKRWRFTYNDRILLLKAEAACGIISAGEYGRRLFPSLSERHKRMPLSATEQELCDTIMMASCRTTKPFSITPRFSIGLLPPAILAEVPGVRAWLFLCDKNSTAVVEDGYGLAAALDKTILSRIRVVRVPGRDWEQLEEKKRLSWLLRKVKIDGDSLP